ncbi:MAG: SpaA isopeptide-forming pilin-related protein [Bacilli bacterium]|nr:SpaA isopeptide-forming pilin-related protein [Bacilli bacterium]
MKKINKIFALLFALLMFINPIINIFAEANDNNQRQITKEGGSNINEADGVSVSKNIYPSELENYFDIILTVQTKNKAVDPDLAVVIVMDISNTMTQTLGAGKTRLDAAKEASNSFIDSFAARSQNSSIDRKLGFVAFNSDSYEIFNLQNCNESNKQSLKDKITTKIEKNIVTVPAAHNKRFTNIESGLKRAKDMLDNSSASKKYILFLSDGFPTTYIQSGYTGYDTYDGNRFKDRVLNKPCSYGTSYSDEAAIRARQMATTIKNSGIGIYSVGVDIGGQTVQNYINQTDGQSHSVVDRYSTSYEIGSADSADAYRNWLRNKIGSGYYYDVNDPNAMTEAFESIFEQIMILSEATWVTEDPMNSSDQPKNIEFIGMYGENNVLSDSVTKTNNYPNTASFDTTNEKIKWDLKNSTPEVNGNTYTYKLKYRVRIENELSNFVEGTSYKTNGVTTLNYIVKTSNSSRTGTIEFPRPEVKAFLGKLEFDKLTNYGNKPLEGTKFEIYHSDDCPCLNERRHMAGDFKMTSTSNSTGKVIFDRIPSGHKYKIHEVYTDEYHEVDNTINDVEVNYGVTTSPLKDGQVINTYKKRNLTIKKFVEGVDTNQEFTFEINAKYKGNNLEGRYTVIRKVDNKQTTEKITFSNGKATIKLKDKEQITINDLPYSTTYIVKELDTDGFIVKYQVNGGVIEIYDAKKQKSYTLNDNMEIKFTNVSGYELPATGSSGMLILIIIGSLLLVVPIIYISVNVLNKKMTMKH